ncbi:MAG: alanine--glyoxylate aminotransferase family protein [Acidimicrobiia bacterium]
MRTPLEPGRFFLPGPTEVHPDVLAAQTGQMIGHRGRAIHELMATIAVGLAPVFQTRRPVVVSTSSATGLMEAAVRNGVGQGGRVLSLVNGAFSARFAEIARGCGREVEVWEVPWGRVHSPEELADRLRGGSFQAVTLSHSETSTGALQPLESLAAVVAAHRGTLLLVDSVTGIGGVETLTDEWGLDFVLTGSQKALALPPGLALGVASEAMMERAVTIPDRGWYFDLERLVFDLASNQTPATPALTLLYALEVQLERVHQEGIEARWKRHAAMQERTVGWVAEMSEAGHHVEMLATEGHRSPTVSCLKVEDPSGVVGKMMGRGWVIGGGYGRLRDETIRIGHMGDHTVDELDDLLGVLTEVIS